MEKRREEIGRLGADDLERLYTSAQRVIYKMSHGHHCVCDARDIVNQLIVDVYDNRRTWNSGIVPDLNVFLQSVMRSKVGDLLKHDRRLERGTPSDGEVHGYEELYTYFPDYEEEFDWRMFENKCRGLFEDDSAALAVLEGILKGSDNREISEDSGIPIYKVENAKKRVRRKLIMCFGRNSARGRTPKKTDDHE
jgi:DNA-directed RNA polymerase specialized sigma24 family protein